jgi:hypothetical protein
LPYGMSWQKLLQDKKPIATINMIFLSCSTSTGNPVKSNYLFGFVVCHLHLLQKPFSINAVGENTNRIEMFIFSLMGNYTRSRST